MTRTIQKRLATAQDIAHGVGKVNQQRGQQMFELDKVDIPLGLATEAEVAAIDPTVYPRVRVGSKEYQAQGAGYQATHDIKPLIYTADVVVTEANPYVYYNQIIFKRIDNLPSTLTGVAADDGLEPIDGTNWEIYLAANSDSDLEARLSDPESDISQLISPLANKVRLAIQQQVAENANVQDAISWVSPEMFAPSSHVWGTDDTVYVQAAIDAASGTQTSAKYGVHLGRLYTAKTLVLKQRCVQISGCGAGTGLRAHADIPTGGAVLLSLRGGATDGPTNQALLDGIYGEDNTPPLRTATTFMENTKLRDFHILAASDGQNARAIWFTGFTRGCQLMNVYTQGFTSGSADGGGSICLNGSWTFSIINVFARGDGRLGTGLALGAPQNGTYSGARVCNSFHVLGGFYGTFGRGINFREGNGAWFGAGLTCELNDRNLVIFNASGWVLSGCYLEASGLDGGCLELGGLSSSGTASEGVVEGCLLYDSSWLIRMQHVRNVRIGKNRLSKQGSNGVLYIPDAIDASALVNVDIELPTITAADVYNLSKINNGQHTLRNLSNGEVSRPLNTATRTSSRQANFGSNNTAPANDAALLASTSSTATATRSTVISSSESTSNSDRASVMSSLRVLAGMGLSVCGGSGGSVGDPASTANRRWQLESTTGNIRYTGSLINSFADFGEYIENGEEAELPLGCLVSVQDGKAKLANDGDNVVGVVSKTAGIMLNDSPFTWKNRYLTGEFGEPLYETVPDSDYELKAGESEADRPLVQRQIENPDFDINAENIPRSERPDEWTPVGMIGQMYVRVNADVLADDFIKAGNAGVGAKSDTETRIKVMSIKQPFDAVKGYAVAYCLRS